MIKFTNIALSSPRTGGKHYTRNSDGTLDKSTVGWINEGRAHVVEVSNMADFATFLKEGLSRPGRNVLTYGLPVREVPEDGLRIVTKRAQARGCDAITRSNDHFAWHPGPGIFAADYDPRDGQLTLSRDDLWSQIVSVVPGIGSHDVLWGCSSSSYIYDSEAGEEIVGLNGQRLYFAVHDASDIPRAADVMLKRLWLAGHGYIFISDSGAQLVRSTLDPCMYQPCRLDYAAGAVCDEGLEQRRPNALLISKGRTLVDTRALLPDVSVDEESEYELLVAEAREDTNEAAMAQREAWVDARLEEEARGVLGGNPSEARVREKVVALIKDGRRDRLMRLVDAERPVLSASHVLHLSDGRTMSVRDVLSNPANYDSVNTADPIEPTYGGGRSTGILYPHNRRLVSQAHGIQKTYILATDDEYAEIHAERCKKAQAKWLTLVDAVGDVLEPDAVDLAVLLSDNEEARARLEQKARDQRSKTEWDKSCNAQRRVFNVEPQPEPNTQGKVRVETADPNALMERTGELEAALGAAHLAFDYGGVASTIRKRKSSHRQVTQRDQCGSAVKDMNGETVKMPVMAAQAEPITPAHMIGLLHQVGYFYETRLVRDRTVRQPVYAPSQLVSNMVKIAGPGLPYLAGVAPHPVMYEGDLLVGSGYHAQSGLWLETGNFTVDNWTDPAEAYQFLRHEWLGDFPFENEKDAAGAIMICGSLMMVKSDLLREAGPPIVAVTAPSAGIGKTLLIDTLHVGVTGIPAGGISMPGDKDERRKIITACVMESSSIISFDNVRTGSTIGNSYSDLHQLCTGLEWEGRILGLSKTYKGPAGVVICLNGNNLLLAADSVSRAYEIRLSAAGITNMVHRKFRHENILEWTRINQSKIVGALACVLQCRDSKIHGNSRFPVWQKKVADPVLVVANAPDFFEVWEMAGREDVKGNVPTGFATLLHAISLILVGEQIQPPGGEWFTASEILDAVFDKFVVKNCFQGQTPDQRELSGYLRRNRDVMVADKHRLHATKLNLGERTHREKSWVFRVERLKGAPDPTTATKVFALMSIKK